MTNILLIDLSSLAHPLYHVSASDPDPNATSTKTVERVRALASGQPYTAICCDSGRSFRKDVDATYKATRPESDAALQHQIALAIDILKADGFPCWAVKGYEADDIIATAATAVTDAQVTIASADKDLLQLVSDRISVKSLTDGTIYDTEAVVKKFGVKPDQMRDYLSLVGDASDNIRGAKGIGAKRAAELLGEYGNLEDLYAALSAHGTQFTPALATSLREFQPRMPTVRELITLRTDVPLPLDDLWRERVSLDAAVFGNALAADTADAAAEAIAEAVKQAQTPAPMVDSSRQPAALRPSEPNGGDSAISHQPSAVTILPAPAEWERALEPRSMHEAKQLAADLFASRLFSAYGNAPAVLSTILAGRELGMQAIASLRAFHIIDGKPTLSADLIRALVIRSDASEYFRCTERTGEKATFVTKRKGDPEVSLTFTLTEGRTAFPGDDKAFAKSGWAKNPADMCVARASAKLARLVYPDVCHGLYAREEFE